MLSSLRYLLSLIGPILCFVGNIRGGYFAATTIAFTVVFMVGLDVFCKSSYARNESGSSVIPNAILLAHVALHSLCIVSLLWGMHIGYLNGWVAAFACVSTGISSGGSGIIVAHELIHRRSRVMRALGIWNLLLVNYAHFCVEHIRNHHKNVGLPGDPATARRGETYYGFLIRTVPAQFASAYAIESARSRARDINGYLRNFVVQSVVIQSALCGAVLLAFGPLALAAYIVQSAIAVSLLEYVNYVEHYGLTRGEFENVSSRHSWQSDVLSSRFTLLELTRHSDHHLHSSKEFPRLASHNDSPQLPAGYFGMFYAALVPPLWFRLMDKRIPERMDG